MTDKEAATIGNDIITISHEIDITDWYAPGKAPTEDAFRAFYRGVEVMAESLFKYFQKLKKDMEDEA